MILTFYLVPYIITSIPQAFPFSWLRDWNNRSTFHSVRSRHCLLHCPCYHYPPMLTRSTSFIMHKILKLPIYSTQCANNSATVLSSAIWCFFWRLPFGLSSSGISWAVPFGPEERDWKVLEWVWEEQCHMKSFTTVTEDFMLIDCVIPHSLCKIIWKMQQQWLDKFCTLGIFNAASLWYPIYFQFFKIALD